METLKICEIFYSISGEAPTVGKPAVFIRTSGCNKQCPWCDTQYHNTGVDLTLDEILEAVRKLTTRCKEIIITGGEPTIQKNISELIRFLRKHGYKIQIETNGSVMFPRAYNMCLIVCSPKLNNWVYDFRKYNKADVYKVVVDNEEQVLQAIDQFGTKSLYLMPRGATREEYLNNAPRVIEWCKEYNLRFSPREHVVVWDKERGV